MKKWGWRRWTWFALLAMVLLPLLIAVVVLHSESATRYALRTAAGKVDGLEMASISGTLREGIAIDNLRFASDKLEVTVRRITLSAKLSALLKRRVIVPQVTVAGVRAAPRNESAPRTPARLTVPEIDLPVSISIHRLLLTDAIWTPLPDVKLDSLSARVNWVDSHVTVEQLDIDTTVGTLDGDARVDLAGDVALDSALRWRYPAANVQGMLSARGSLASLEIQHELTGEYRLSSAGRVALLGRIEPVIDIVHTCMTDCGGDPAVIRDLVVHHSGTPGDSVIDLTLEVATADIAPVNIRGKARLLEQTLDIESLTANGAIIDAATDGQVALTQPPKIELATRIRHLDASALNATMSGSLSGELAIAGSSPEQFDVALKTLSGTINGFALAGRGQARRNADTLSIRDTQITLGDNRITIKGSGTPAALNFDAALALRNLQQFDARLGGAFTGQATVTGSPDSPQVKAQGTGSDLQFAQSQIRSFAATLSTNAKREVQGTVSAQDVRQGGREVGAVELQVGGTLDAFDAELNLIGGKLQGQIETRVVRTDMGVNARINQANIATQEFGQWSVTAPFTVTAQDARIGVSAHTWQNETAFAHLESLSVSDQDITLNAQLEELPFAVFAPFLPPDVQAVGRIGAKVDVRRRANNWQGTVQWDQADTVLKLRAPKGSRRLALPVVSLRAERSADNASATLQVQGDFGLNIDANLVATRPELLGESPLVGTLRANVKEVSWLTPWLGEVSNLAGRFEADLEVAGTFNSPLLGGALQFVDGAVTFDDAGLQLDQLQFQARGTANSALALTGAAQSGGGTLRFDGTLNEPWTDARQLELEVSGTNVQAFNAADYQLWLSPDVTLVANQSGATIDGRVEVPRADIRVRELPPDVVRPSADIKVAQRDDPDTLVLPFAGDIDVVLGENVHVFALGLDSDVGGELRVRLLPEQPPRLDGRIFLNDGKYAAYGQKLDIERGNLIFAGPIDNPTLDIRAARKVSGPESEVTAGVMVSGPATTPDVAIFAEPSMSQTDALSYLLLGRAADNTSGAEGEALSQAALAIGMSRSTPLAAQLASGLGLDELSVGGDSVEAAELVAGKQINDRLYISYRYGVFSNLGAILLRYKLSRRLALEAGSADAQSLDVLYTIEK